MLTGVVSASHPGSSVSTLPSVPQILCHRSPVESCSQNSSSHPLHTLLPWLRRLSSLDTQPLLPFCQKQLSHHLLQEASPGCTPWISLACSLMLCYSHLLICLPPSTCDQPEGGDSVLSSFCHYIPLYHYGRLTSCEINEYWNSLERGRSSKGLWKDTCLASRGRGHKMAVTHAPSIGSGPLSYYTSSGTWGVRGHAY